VVLQKLLENDFGFIALLSEREQGVTLPEEDCADHVCVGYRIEPSAVMRSDQGREISGDFDEAEVEFHGFAGFVANEDAKAFGFV